MTNKRIAKLPTTRAVKGSDPRNSTRQRKPASNALHGCSAARPVPALRGILQTNAEIESFLKQILKDRPASAAARQRMQDDLKMQYYFGGQPVMYRESEQGKDVLAVGYDEIRSFRRKTKKLPSEEQQKMIVGWWHPW